MTFPRTQIALRGTSGTERHPAVRNLQHTFCCPGSYTVSLAATNENGTSSASIVVTVLPASEENVEAADSIGSSDVTENSVNTGNSSDNTECTTCTADEPVDANNIIDAEGTENSESKSNSGGEGTGNARILHREELESIKDSVISTASSKILTETGLSLENETLKVQKNVEDFVDDSLPESVEGFLTRNGTENRTLDSVVPRTCRDNLHGFCAEKRQKKTKVISCEDRE